MMERDLYEDIRADAEIMRKIQDDLYAKSVYAALCNVRWQPRELFDVLKDDWWACSWRYAGGIVAHMRQEGDYIDWYCSGIGGGDLIKEDRDNMTAEAIARYEWMREHFVGEGHVTDEIREDLLKLGWIVVDDDDNT